MIVSDIASPEITKPPAISAPVAKKETTVASQAAEKKKGRLANNDILTGGKTREALVVVKLEKSVLGSIFGFILTITLVGVTAAAYASILHYTLGTALLLHVAVPLAVNAVAFTLIKLGRINIRWAYDVNYIACMAMASRMPLIYVLQKSVPEISGYFGLLQRTSTMTPYVYMQSVLLLLMTINHFGLPLLDSFLEERKYSVEKRKIFTGFLFMVIGLSCVVGILVSMGMAGRINPDLVGVIFITIASLVTYSGVSELFDEFFSPNSDKRRSNLRKLVILVSLGLAAGAITLASIYRTPTMITNEFFIPGYVQVGGWIKVTAAKLLGMTEYARNVMVGEPEIVSEESSSFLRNLPGAVFSGISSIGPRILSLFGFGSAREYVLSYGPTEQ